MCRKLIINKSVLLTGLLILLTSVTYTYSEGYPSRVIVKQMMSNQRNLTFTVTNHGYSAILPIDYYLAIHALKSKKTVSALVFPSEQIMGFGVTDVSRLEAFLLTNNRNVEKSFAQTLAQLYLEESAREGVNPDVAFTQMCLETGFLRFDGTVDREQNNYCGLGVTGNGVKGEVFSNARLGVRAHIQHLKAYASTEDLKDDVVDMRFRFVKRGSAEEITDLTGKWATDKHYDRKIRYLLQRLSQTN